MKVKTVNLILLSYSRPYVYELWGDLRRHIPEMSTGGETFTRGEYALRAIDRTDAFGNKIYRGMFLEDLEVPSGKPEDIEKYFTSSLSRKEEKRYVKDSGMYVVRQAIKRNFPVVAVSAEMCNPFRTELGIIAAKNKVFITSSTPEFVANFYKTFSDKRK